MPLRSPLKISPHFYMGDTRGRPLDGGRVFIGKPNTDPELYPVNVFFDEALTIPAPQPIRTKAGFVAHNGNISGLYTAALEYSVKVLDANNVQILSRSSVSAQIGFNDVVNGTSTLTAIVDNINIDIAATAADNIATPEKVSIDSMASLPNYVGNIMGFKKGVYTSSLFQRVNNASIFGGGSILNINPADPVSVRIGSNSTVDGIHFKCLNASLPDSRATMELTDGATFSNCNFEGFRDPVNENGWGLYLSDTTNANIKNCKFANNTTYDITIVDNVNGVSVDNVKHIDGRGCVMVVEPNTPAIDKFAVDNISIKNSLFSLFCIMENASPYTMSKVNLSNSKVDKLLLWGGMLNIVDCNVSVLEQNPRFMTRLKWDSLLVSRNELEGVNPTLAGSKGVAPIVDFQGAPAYRFDIQDNPYLDTARVYTIPSLAAAKYILTIDAADIAGNNAGSLIGLGVYLNKTDKFLLPKLGAGKYTPGSIYRGKSSYVIDHAGGEIKITVGLLAAGGINTVAFLMGVSLNKILDLNSSDGNFNNLELAPPYVEPPVTAP